MIKIYQQINESIKLYDKINYFHNEKSTQNLNLKSHKIIHTFIH